MSKNKELAELIKKKIDDAYEAGKIQTMADFDRVFLEMWESLGTGNNQFGGVVRTLVQHKNPLYILLRREDKEVHRPITEESPIEHLPISKKVYSSLYRGGVRKVKHIIDILLKEGENGFLAIRNMGPESVKEVYDALDWAEIEIPPQLEPEEGETIPVYGHNIELPEKEEQELIARGAGQERKIILDNGETFKAEIFPGNSGEIVIIGHKQLTVRARKIVIEAFG